MLGLPNFNFKQSSAKNVFNYLPVREDDVEDFT